MTDLPLTEEEKAQIRSRLHSLEIEHHDLDDVINRLHWGPNNLYLHGGETVGYNSEAAYDPKNKLTLVVWSNLTISPFEGLTANRLMLLVVDNQLISFPNRSSGALTGS